MKPMRCLRSFVKAEDDIFAMFWLSRRMSPDVGRSSPARMWRRVVLPQPDGPVRAIHSPFGRSRLRFLMTSIVPPARENDLQRFLIWKRFAMVCRLLVE